MHLKINSQRLIKDIKRLIKIRMKILSIDTSKRSLRIVYTRYADDWIILTNSNKKFGQELTSQIDKWLKDNLNLSVSKEKTKITNLKEKKASFLGFSIYTYKNRRFSKRKLGNTVKDAGCKSCVFLR
jgi:hypothetical protein